MPRILVAAVLALALFASNAYSQQSTPQERRIYYEFVEQVVKPYAGDKEEYDSASNRFAQSHNMSVEQLNNILGKIDDEDLTPQEERIWDECTQMLVAVQKQGVVTNIKEIYKKVAAKYGLSAAVVEDIIIRAMDSGLKTFLGD